MLLIFFHSLEEESSLPSCPSSLKLTNQLLGDNWQQMLVAFDKIETYTRLLNDSLLPSVIHKAFNSIIVGVADLHKSTKGSCGILYTTPFASFYNSVGVGLLWLNLSLVSFYLLICFSLY